MQHAQLAVAAVQALRHGELLGHVALRDHEGQHAAVATPLLAAALQVALQAERALVALFGCFCQQLHRDLRHRQRHCRHQIRRRRRHLGQVAMHQLERIGRGERQLSGQQLVHHDTERIKVAAVVAGHVDAPGLFRRRVGEPAARQRRCQRHTCLPCAARRAGEIGQAHAPRRLLDQHGLRPHAAMHDAALVQLGQHGGQLRHMVEHPAQRQPVLARQRCERDAAVVFEHQRASAVFDHEVPRPCDRVDRQALQQLELALEPGHVGIGRRHVERAFDQHAAAVALAPGTAQDEALVAREFLGKPVAAHGGRFARRHRGYIDPLGAGFGVRHLSGRARRRQAGRRRFDRNVKVSRPQGDPLQPIIGASDASQKEVTARARRRGRPGTSPVVRCTWWISTARAALGPMGHGLADAERRPHDLVILDLMLPGIDGSRSAGACAPASPTPILMPPPRPRSSTACSGSSSAPTTT